MTSVIEQKPEVNTGITVGFNKQDDTHYQAASSDGETWYDMTVYPTTGTISCKCPARVECKHIRNLRLLLAADGWDAWATKRNAQAVAAGIVSAERVETERQMAQAARRSRAAQDKEELNGAVPAQMQRILLSNGTSTFLGSTVADGEGWL